MHIYLLIIFLSIISYWVVQIIHGKLPLLDDFLEQLLRDFVSYEPFFNFARFITELGSKTFLVPFVSLMAIIFFIIFRSIVPSVIFAGGTLFSHIINVLIKEVVQRERPFIWLEASAYGYSFPSGHAMISLVCYSLLAYFLSLKIKQIRGKQLLFISFSLLIFLIGLSRFVLNVHYMTDILSGFMLGYLLLLGFIYLARRFVKNK